MKNRVTKDLSNTLKKKQRGTKLPKLNNKKIIVKQISKGTLIMKKRNAHKRKVIENKVNVENRRKGKKMLSLRWPIVQFMIRNSVKID